VVVDHSGNSFCVNCSSVSVNLTISHPEDVIYVVTYDSQIGSETMSVSSRPSLVWKNRIALSTPNDMATWYAVWVSSGSVKITYKTGELNINEVIMAFGISGANTTQPFDTSPTVAAVCSTLCTRNQSVILSTIHSNDFVIGAINAAGGGTMTGGQCCTKITGLSAGSIEYVLPSSPQTSLNLVYTSQQDPTRWLFIADAVVS
jgi:hypothetical protein